MMTKRSATILLAAVSILLTQCGQPTEPKTEETPAPPKPTQQEQRQVANEEAEKTFKLEVVDEYIWRGKEHQIQVVNDENENVEAHKDNARNKPPSNCQYL
jgi:PBP1b-binding outer membrane lipoprotein LpoB